MTRTLTALGATLGVLLTSSLAQAQTTAEFGDKGEFILSADRLFPLFGFSRVSQAVLPTPMGAKKANTVDTQTSFSFFNGASPIAADNAIAIGATIPNAVPRLGFDYTVIPHLTVGGNLIAFFTLGGSTSTDTTATNGTSASSSTSNPSVTAFGLEGRAGYILPLTSLMSLWLRGGFSYYLVSVKTTTTDMNNNKSTETASTDQFSLDLEPQLVITPVNHFGITVGLTADVPILGGHSDDQNANGTSQSLSGNSAIFFFGATAGLIGWF